MIASVVHFLHFAKHVGFYLFTHHVMHRFIQFAPWSVNTFLTTEIVVCGGGVGRACCWGAGGGACLLSL